MARRRCFPGSRRRPWTDPLGSRAGRPLSSPAHSSRLALPSSMSSHSWAKSSTITSAGASGIQRNRLACRIAKLAPACAVSAQILAGRAGWRRSRRWRMSQHNGRRPRESGWSRRCACGGQATAYRMRCARYPAGDAEHRFAKMLAGSADYAQNHAARRDDPPFRKRTWTRANPSLSAMRDLLAVIRAEAGQARRDPSLLPAFEALRLNLGTEDASVSVLTFADLWRGIEGEAERGAALFWGVDLGTSAAQSVIAAYWPETAALAAFPREPSLADRGLRDGVGGLYSECARRGELVKLGGAAVDIPALLSMALERFGRPCRIVVDRWREAELRHALKAAGVPLAALELRGQGFKDGAEDVRGFRRACADRRVVPAPSLLLWSAMAEARTVRGPAGNAKLSKASQGGRRAERGTMQRRRRCWPWRRGIAAATHRDRGGAMRAPSVRCRVCKLWALHNESQYVRIGNVSRGGTRNAWHAPRTSSFPTAEEQVRFLKSSRHLAIGTLCQRRRSTSGFGETLCA